MRRFMPLTHWFSKKVESHAAAIALYVANHNFARIHQAPRVTPAMDAGIADHAREVEGIVALLEVRQEAAV